MSKLLTITADADEVAAVHAIVGTSKAINDANVAGILQLLGADERQSAGLAKAVLESDCDFVPETLWQIQNESAGPRRDWLLYVIAVAGLRTVRTGGGQKLSSIAFRTRIFLEVSRRQLDKSSRCGRSNQFLGTTDGASAVKVDQPRNATANRMMHTGFYNLVTVLLEGDNDTPVPDEAIAKSQFLQAAFTLNLARIVVPAAEEMNTANLGELWKDISPVDGKYNLEIATILPYYLPDFGESPEYVVDVDGAELVVSSRMLRCFFTDENGHTEPLQYYLVHRRGLKSLCEQRKLSHTHPVPLHTFVSKRFVVAGDSCQTDSSESIQRLEKRVRWKSLSILGFNSRCQSEGRKAFAATSGRYFPVDVLAVFARC